METQNNNHVLILNDLEKMLKEHCLDVHGNIYTVTVEQVKNTILEFIRKNPELAEKISALDLFSLAVEIQDFIGGIGMSDHIEIAIHAAIIDRIEHEMEAEDAQ